MRISVLGAGKIGGTIGKKWAEKGHAVTFGVRDASASKVTDLLSSIEGNVAASSIGKAIEDAEVVLLAIPGMAVEETLTDHLHALDGKIVIDATNKVGQSIMNSLDVIRVHAPEARLFRAFHNLGWENFANPIIGGVQADLFYCGEAGPDQEVVNGLIGDVGIRPVYIGGLEQASLVDSLTGLWFGLAILGGRGRHLAFKMLEG